MLTGLSTRWRSCNGSHDGCCLGLSGHANSACPRLSFGQAMRLNGWHILKPVPVRAIDPGKWSGWAKKVKKL